MSHFERGSERHQIPTGESALAIQTGNASVVPGPGGPGRRAILRASPEGEVVIVKVQDADLMINGVRLGTEPTPLLHGDKVGAEGVELTFVDERRSGSTVFMAAMQAPAAGSAAPAPTAGTTARGGRLVCLTDGREYSMAGTSLVFGREAGCDVVVPGKDVSRRHAEILATGKGYLLIDHSTNGTFVNDERIAGQRLLVRGDLIRVGADEFRFHADQEAQRESTPRHAALQETLHDFPVAAASPPAGAAEARPAPSPPSPAPDAGRGAPSEARAGAPYLQTLASFLLRGGEQKGVRLSVRGLVANVGRAEYNDIVLHDDSVSAQHAKLQRREGIWVLVDLDSTNGTYVDGERVAAEAALAPGSLVRFGEVKAIFEPMDDALGMGTGAPKTSLVGRQEIGSVEEEVGASRPSAGVGTERAESDRDAQAPGVAARSAPTPPPMTAPGEATPVTPPSSAEAPADAAADHAAADQPVEAATPASPPAPRVPASSRRRAPAPRPPAPSRADGVPVSWIGMLVAAAALVAVLLWFFG